MKPMRFTEEQIIGILRDQEAGAKTADLCRNTGSAAAHPTNGSQVAASKCLMPGG
jgi:hypothetical protein